MLEIRLTCYCFDKSKIKLLFLPILNSILFKQLSVPVFDFSIDNTLRLFEMMISSSVNLTCDLKFGELASQNHVELSGKTSIPNR